MAASTRDGFSLIEALVVLAIGGMALSIIFSIGIKAGDSGFAIGRRAMAAADADVANSDVRAIFRSFLIRPAVTVREDVDLPFEGEPRRMEGDVVMERATQCASQGWAGRMVLEISPVEGGGSALVCQAGERRATLLTFRDEGADFAYSRDARTWQPQIVTTTRRPLDAELRSEHLFIRLGSASAGDIIDVAASGVPQTWVRVDEF